MSNEKQTPFASAENIASACECTGLMPTLSEDQPDAETETAKLYAIHAPARPKHKRVTK